MPNNDFWANLDRITGSLAPEEGDFNTAAIQSGMSAQERRWLQQDLESVEVQDPYEDLYAQKFDPLYPEEEDWDFWEEDDTEEEDDIFPYICDRCGRALKNCICIPI